MNLPWEPDEQLLTNNINQFADVEGQPRYPTKTFNQIKYQIGTRVHRVSNIVKDISGYMTLFGWKIRFIYTGQPKHINEHSDNDNKNEENNIDTETNNENNDHIDQQQN